MIVVNESRTRLLIPFIASFLALLSASLYAGDKSVIELNHWWTSKGELAAVDVIKKAAEQRGAEFETVTADNYNNFRINVIERVNLGYLPSIAHWLGGKELQQLKDHNILQSLPEKTDGKPIKDVLFDQVIAETSRDDALVAIPVGIHIQNSTYYNAKIYDELNLSPPDTWKTLFEQLEVISKAGYTPIAVGTEPWQLSFLTDALLISYGGKEALQEIFLEDEPIDKWRGTLIRVFKSYLALKPYTNPAHGQQKWSENVKSFVEGEAAIHFMGDFAMGELTALGALPNKDFYCETSPENNNVLFYGVDVFALLKVADPELKAGQAIMVDTILSQGTQSAFVNKKGGIPVRSDIDMKKLNTCSAQAYQKWTDSKYSHIPISAGSSRTKMATYYGLAMELWTQETPDIETTVDKLISVIHKLNK
mgnify:CR=1 FL=1